MSARSKATSISNPTVGMVIAALDLARQRITAGHLRGQATAVIDGTRCYDPLGALAASCATVHTRHDDDDGTLVAVPGQWIFEAAAHALQALLPNGFRTVAEFNDASTHQAVIQLFSRAATAVAGLGA